MVEKAISDVGGRKRTAVLLIKDIDKRGLTVGGRGCPGLDRDQPWIYR